MAATLINTKSLSTIAQLVCFLRNKELVEKSVPATAFAFIEKRRWSIQMVWVIIMGFSIGAQRVNVAGQGNLNVNHYSAF